MKNYSVSTRKAILIQRYNSGFLNLLGWIFQHIIKWIFILTIFFFTLGPIVWLIISSFKTNFELFESALSLPSSWSFANYVKALTVDGFGRTFINTVAISFLTVLFNLLFASMAAYAMKYKVGGAKKMNFFLTLGIYIPVNAFMIPYALMITQINLYNTIWGLILVYTATGLPLSIMVIRGYMDTLPNGLFEAAKIDGSGFISTYIRIVLPLSGPGLATIGIFQFIAAWNEFLYAMLLTQNLDARTLQISMRMFTGSFITDYATSMAIVVLCILPTIIAYIFFQRQIISGMTSGALKG